MAADQAGLKCGGIAERRAKRAYLLRASSIPIEPKGALCVHHPAFSKRAPEVPREKSTRSRALSPCHASLRRSFRPYEEVTCPTKAGHLVHGLSRRLPVLIAADIHGSRVTTKKDLGANCSSLTATAVLSRFFLLCVHAHSLTRGFITKTGSASNWLWSF